MDSESGDSGGKQWLPTIQVALQRLLEDKEAGDEKVEKFLAMVPRNPTTLAELKERGLMDVTSDETVELFEREVRHAVASGKNLTFVLLGPSGAGKSETFKKFLKKVDKIADDFAEGHTGVVLHCNAACALPVRVQKSTNIQRQDLFKEHGIVKSGGINDLRKAIEKRTGAVAVKFDLSPTVATPQNERSSRVLTLCHLIISTHNGNESKSSHIVIVDCPGREVVAATGRGEESKNLQSMVVQYSQAMVSFLCCESLDNVQKSMIEQTMLATTQARFFLVTSIPSLKEPPKEDAQEFQKYIAKIHPVKYSLWAMANVAQNKCADVGTAGTSAGLSTTPPSFNYPFEINDDNIRNHDKWAENYGSTRQDGELPCRTPPAINRHCLPKTLSKTTLKELQNKDMPPMSTIKVLDYPDDDEFSEYALVSTEPMSTSDYVSATIQSPQRGQHTTVEMDSNRAKCMKVLDTYKSFASGIMLFVTNDPNYNNLALKDRVAFLACAYGAMLENGDGDSCQVYRDSLSSEVSSHINTLRSPTTDSEEGTDYGERMARQGLLDAFKEFHPYVKMLRGNEDFWTWALKVPSECVPNIFYLLLLLSVHFNDLKRLKAMVDSIADAGLKGHSFLSNLIFDAFPHMQETASENSDCGGTEGSNNQEGLGGSDDLSFPDEDDGNLSVATQGSEKRDDGARSGMDGNEDGEHRSYSSLAAAEYKDKFSHFEEDDAEDFRRALLQDAFLRYIQRLQSVMNGKPGNRYESKNFRAVQTHVRHLLDYRKGGFKRVPRDDEWTFRPDGDDFMLEDLFQMSESSPRQVRKFLVELAQNDSRSPHSEEWNRINFLEPEELLLLLSLNQEYWGLRLSKTEIDSLKKAEKESLIGRLQNVVSSVESVCRNVGSNTGSDERKILPYHHLDSYILDHASADESKKIFLKEEECVLLWKIPQEADERSPFTGIMDWAASQLCSAFAEASPFKSLLLGTEYGRVSGAPNSENWLYAKVERGEDLKAYATLKERSLQTLIEDVNNLSSEQHGQLMALKSELENELPLKVLHACHTYSVTGLLHRDVKPSNFLVVKREGGAHSVVVLSDHETAVPGNELAFPRLHSITTLEYARPEDLFAPVNWPCLHGGDDFCMALVILQLALKTEESPYSYVITTLDQDCTAEEKLARKVFVNGMCKYWEKEREFLTDPLSWEETTMLARFAYAYLVLVSVEGCKHVQFVKDAWNINFSAFLNEDVLQRDAARCSLRALRGKAQFREAMVFRHDSLFNYLLLSLHPAETYRVKAKEWIDGWKRVEDY